MTKHVYLPTTPISDKGPASLSHVIKQVAGVHGITLNHATTKQAQSIGMLERSHASTIQASGVESAEQRSLWHKYLRIAVLNYNTSYHAIIGCEPSRLFHGRIPYNVLDLKKGVRRKKMPAQIHTMLKIYSNKRKWISKMPAKMPCKFISKTKRIIIKKPTPQNSQNFVLCTFYSLTEHQESKIPFTDFRWIGLYLVEKALSKNIYLVRKPETNKTQVFHRMRLRLFTSRQPIPDLQTTSQDWKRDPRVIVKHDDLYAKAWESE